MGISELFAQKQINFVTMFCLYFKLLRQYLDKCKLAETNYTKHQEKIDNNICSQLLPQQIAPSLINKPNSMNVDKQNIKKHKRTFSQRNSVSAGLKKFQGNQRSETSRDFQFLQVEKKIISLNII